MWVYCEDLRGKASLKADFRISLEIGDQPEKEGLSYKGCNNSELLHKER